MIEPARIEFANLPTPIHKVTYNNSTFFIKRDDYTGSELSGNKIRKLEYLLADAKKKKTDLIITCGGEQSNHCRAAAIAAAKLGIKTKLYLWGKAKKNPSGNHLLYKMLNAQVEFLSFKEYQEVGSLMLEELELNRRNGINSYIIPTGGSNPLGIWGYITFIREIATQEQFQNTKGILCANGSGGTAAGMLLGCSLMGIKKKVYGVNVIGNKKQMTSVISSIIEECIHKYELEVKVDYNQLELLDGYSDEGYKKTALNKIKIIKDFFIQTGIVLDPTYTGKAFFAYNEKFLKPNKRSNILFLHTGGIFGLFPKSAIFT
jgi:D-cysteine desulfhydrase